MFSLCIISYLIDLRKEKKKKKNKKGTACPLPEAESVARWSVSHVAHGLFCLLLFPYAPHRSSNVNDHTDTHTYLSYACIFH